EMGGVLLQLTPLLLLGKAGGEDEPVQEVVGAIVTPGGTAVPFPILQSIAERISSTARSSLSAKWGERL
ncbi:MAG TPA: hypothetical protein VKU41_02510, partial [Polyangiaceae bacterium]|nr:hypothetical protein [Polyangiaceae bacterium]